MDDTQHEGVIKKLADKGFGFISVEGKKKDVFFHMSALKKGKFTDLHEGDVVTFDGLKNEERGEAAFGVALKS